MDIFKYILLGLIQGITEFLPVSSSGHLIIAREFLDIPQSMELDVILHFATLLAVVIFYREKLFKMVLAVYDDIPSIKKGSAVQIWKYLSNDSKLFIYLTLASVPAAFFGITFENFFENIRSVFVVAVMLFVVAIYMLFAQIKSGGKSLSSLQWYKAVLIGFSQVLALIPGTSRSGVTITTGSLLGLKKESAADFSFLMSIPVILGGFLLTLLDINLELLLDINLAFAFIVSFISGLLSIRFLISILKKLGFIPFIIYRIILGLLLFLIIL